ncbi:MAG: hypothetical protein AMXMBFR13_26290 [Phycisphaerae bacterium]
MPQALQSPERQRGDELPAAPQRPNLTCFALGAPMPTGRVGMAGAHQQLARRVYIPQNGARYARLGGETRCDQHCEYE